MTAIESEEHSDVPAAVSGNGVPVNGNGALTGVPSRILAGLRSIITR